MSKMPLTKCFKFSELVGMCHDKQLDHLKSKVTTANKQVNELEKRLKESTAFRGITLDETSNSDFLNIMEENDASTHKQFAERIFQRIFLAATASGCKSRRFVTD